MVDIVVANDDEATTTDSVPVAIPILLNDRLNGVAPTPRQVAIVITSQPSHGTIQFDSVNGTGVVTYTPDLGFVGDDSFDYILQTGPHIGGEAPDGDGSEAYSFSYTTTPGVAPISHTVLLGAPLPDGWLWDEATATISHPTTPIEVAPLSLSMRVYDTSGLWAEHSDSFSIVVPLWLGIVPASTAAVRPLLSTFAWRAGADTQVTALTPSSIKSVARYGGSIYVALLNAGASALVHSGVSDLSTWAPGLALPVAGERIRIGVSGSRLFNWGQSSTSVHYIDSPADLSWSSTSLTGGFTSNNIEQFRGDGVRVVCANRYGTLWGSTDNGNTFTKGAELFGVDRFYTYQCMMDCNDGRFIIGGEDDIAGGAYYTDDVGATATRCSFPEGVRNQQPSQVKYCGDGRWLIAFGEAPGSTDSGLYLSIDNGVTFRPVSLPVNMSFNQEFGQAIATFPDPVGVIVAGAEVGTNAIKFFRSTDFIEWAPIDMAGTGAHGIAELYPIGVEG